MHPTSAWQSDRLLLRTLFVVAVVVVTIVSSSASTALAQYQDNRVMPDFYTRPTVSPYLDLLNPGLGPINLRYQSLRNKQAAQKNEKQAQVNYQTQLQQQTERDRKYEEDKRAAELRSKKLAEGSVNDPRVGGPERRSPFHLPAADRTTGFFPQHAAHRPQHPLWGQAGKPQPPHDRPLRGGQ